jgi:biopolymer transport protein ExbD
MAVRLSSGEDDLEVNHEINVTPFIDVILVLLIIFMVAAPLSTVDVNVDLPASTAQPAQRPDKPLFLTVKSDLSLTLGEDPVSRGALAGALDAATQADREARVFVRADKAVTYGDVMETMNLLRAAGYLKIGLVGMEAGQDAAPPPGEKRKQTESASKPAASPENAAPSLPASKTSRR